MQPVSRSRAARKLRCSRRTVQRYCQREPGIVQNGKINLDALIAAIAAFKFRDSRGFPLGRKRSQRKLPLDAPKKERPIIHRALNQRLEIIAREFNAMTDAEQVQLLEMGPQVLLRLFRLKNCIQVANKDDISAAGVDKKP
jgi:hypothetical protein